MYLCIVVLLTIQMPVYDMSGVFLNHFACYLYLYRSRIYLSLSQCLHGCWKLNSIPHTQGESIYLHCHLFVQPLFMYTLQIQSVDNFTQHFQQFIVLSKDSACCTIRKKKYYYLHQPYGHTTAVRNQRDSCLCAVGIVTTGIRCVQGNWAVEEQLKNADAS